jgi:D-3-phosphoglycerate dehydrogenase
VLGSLIDSHQFRAFLAASLSCMGNEAIILCIHGLRQSMQAVFVDANDTLAAVAERLISGTGMLVKINRQPDITPKEIVGVIGDASIAWIDHTALPTEVARACPALRHVIFLGTGARSCMDPEELLSHGITVHTISGYGDTAVAEMAVSLMWAAAKSLSRMDRQVRAGSWIRTDGIQLAGKTIGLVGFGGIAREMVPLVPFMRVLAWNRTPKICRGVEFVDLNMLLRESNVVSMHLLLTAETRGILSREKLALMRPQSILVNTARGALVDEAAMIDSLRSGKLGHAALDVYEVEPLPVDHPLTQLQNVTLSAHSAFRTPEASERLIRMALDHMRRILRRAE